MKTNHIIEWPVQHIGLKILYEKQVSIIINIFTWISNFFTRKKSVSNYINFKIFFWIKSGCSVIDFDMFFFPMQSLEFTKSVNFGSISKEKKLQKKLKNVKINRSLVVIFFISKLSGLNLKPYIYTCIRLKKIKKMSKWIPQIYIHIYV